MRPSAPFSNRPWNVWPSFSIPGGEYEGFKEFLLKNNVFALAVAVIVGGAVGKVVSSLAADILMPVISLVMPSGEWRSAKLVIGTSTGSDGKEVVNALNYGTFFGNVVDFVIIAFVVYLMTKALLREKPAPAPAAKSCPRCKESIALDATKCKFCTADI
jgi:large conductance mechanosensitive channel